MSLTELDGHLPTNASKQYLHCMACMNTESTTLGLRHLQII